MIKSGEYKVKIGKGVIQGGVLSPTLFIIMIDDLINELERNGNTPFVFADDLSTVQEGIEKTKEAIKIIDEWTERN